MAYSSGTFTDQFDLLGKIKLLLEDNGYTIDSYTYDSSSYSPTYSPETSANAKRLHAHKNGVYVNFRSTKGASIFPQNTNGGRYGIGFNLGTGYDPSKNWISQTGAPIENATGYGLAGFTWCNQAGSYKIFLFDSPFTLIVYLNFTSTFVSYIYLGEMSAKYGAWDGGKFFFSSNRVDDSDSTKNSTGSSGYPLLYLFSYTTAEYSVNGAINISTAGVVPSGGTWVTSGRASSGTTSDTLFLPPNCGYWSLTSRTVTSCSGSFNTSYLQVLPSSIVSPILLFPAQVRMIRNISLTNTSFLGELSHVKITSVPVSLFEQVVTYAGQEYMLLPIYTVLGSSNSVLAVEYDGV